MSTSAQHWGWHERNPVCRNCADNVERPGGQIYNFRMFQINKEKSHLCSLLYCISESGHLLLFHLHPLSQHHCLLKHSSLIAVIYQSTPVTHTHTHTPTIPTISSVFPPPLPFVSHFLDICSSLGPFVAMLQFSGFASSLALPVFILRLLCLRDSFPLPPAVPYSCLWRIPQ